MLGEAAGVLIGELVCGRAQSKQNAIAANFWHWFSP